MSSLVYIYCMYIWYIVYKVNQLLLCVSCICCLLAVHTYIPIIKFNYCMFLAVSAVVHCTFQYPWKDRVSGSCLPLIYWLMSWFTVHMEGSICPGFTNLSQYQTLAGVWLYRQYPGNLLWTTQQLKQSG